MPVRLLMLAHAETAATRQAAFAAGEGLAPRGRDAAAAMSLPRHDLAFASPAPAARETAARLAAQETPALRDLDVGSWAGQSLADIAAADPAGAAAFFADPAFDGHGGESIATLIARMNAWLEEMRDGRGQIVAITHSAVVRATAVAVLGAPASAFWHIDVAPLSSLTFGSDGRRWTLRAG